MHDSEFICMLSPKLKAIRHISSELRKQAGLSQEELAHRAELDRSYVGEVERGKRSISLESIYRLAAGLETRPVELVL